MTLWKSYLIHGKMLIDCVKFLIAQKMNYQAKYPWKKKQTKRVLEKSSTPLYNLLRKVIGSNFRLALSIKYDYKNSIQTLGGRDAISFCYDCLCKTEPQRLPVKA